jgi:hypothetical protein
VWGGTLWANSQIVMGVWRRVDSLRVGVWTVYVDSLRGNSMGKQSTSKASGVRQYLYK